MFTIQEIETGVYRKKTRNATLIIMAMFIVIGMITATLTVHFLGPYNNNHLVLNFIGAFIGLIITFFIMKTFFIDKPWMAEAMYAWRLKRTLMRIYNALGIIQQNAKEQDVTAMKILRFYHLGLTQMNQLENNSHGQYELTAEKNELAEQMRALNLDLNQTSFDTELLETYKTKEA